jgi:hypothetical protein
VVDNTNRLQVFDPEGKHLCTRSDLGLHDASTSTSDCMMLPLRSRVLHGAQVARLQWQTAVQTMCACGTALSLCSLLSAVGPGPAEPRARAESSSRSRLHSTLGSSPHTPHQATPDPQSRPRGSRTRNLAAEARCYTEAVV